MTRAATVGADRRHTLHRRATLLERFTVAWNVLEAFVAIGAGILAGSVALVSFGIDSSIEVLAAVAVLWRLRKAGADATAHEEQHAERRAMYLVAATFFLLAAYITYEAVTALIDREAPDSSTVGLVLAAVSLIVMPALAWLKQRAERLHVEEQHDAGDDVDREPEHASGSSRPLRGPSRSVGTGTGRLGDRPFGCRRCSGGRRSHRDQWGTA